MKKPTFIARARRRTKRAFTLIEIMVATAIMVVLVGLVIQITSQVLNVWARSSGRLSALASARIAMELITQDLETAVFRNNNMQWLRAENSIVTTPGGSTNTVSLKLFSPALDRPEGPGDICAIGYLLRYADPVSGEESGDDRLFVLYRKVISPETTFNELMGVGSQETLDWGAWSSGEGADGETPVSTSTITADDYLVSNIASFEIKFHVEDDGNPATTTLVPGDTLFGGTSSTVGAGADVSARFQKPLAYADIRLTVLSDEGAAILQSMAVTGEDLNSVLLQHSQVFYRRVYFPARPI
jgi:prepilin-type N-terminal cleavage/methylation domain-containing protein